MRKETKQTKSIYMCWRQVLVKGVALVEVIAMTVLLLYGFSIDTPKEVFAEDINRIEVNTEVAIASEGDEVVYTFIAPEDGTYYFFTEGEYDTYGTLTVGEEIYENYNDGFADNFLIEKYLYKNQECTIGIRQSSYGLFESTLVVCDESRADNYIVESPDQGLIYASEGESVTFIPYITISGNDIDTDINGYSIKWYKEENGNYADWIELEATGMTYTVENVSESDFYSYSKTCYIFYIYYNGKHIYSEIRIYNKADNVYGGNSICYARTGESVTLTPTFYDYANEKIDITGGGYSVEWYRSSGDTEEILLEGKEFTYTISEVEESDFYDNDTTYTCKLYRNEKYLTSASVSIYDKKDVVKISGSSSPSAKIGDTVTLEVNATDYDGNELDFSSGEYTVEWYRVTDYNLDTKIKVDGNGLTCTISNVQLSDFYDGLGNIGTRFWCCIYRKGKLLNNAWCHIGNRYSYIYMNVPIATYASIGETVKFAPVLNGNGEVVDTKEVDLSEYGYSVKWTKVIDTEEEYKEIELNESGFEYTIANVQPSDFEDGTYYVCTLYKDGQYMHKATFGIRYIYESYVEYDEVRWGSVGESLKLTPKLSDHRENMVKLNPEEYTFEWYKLEDGVESDVLGTGYIYIIDEISDNDFWKGKNVRTRYMCRVYKDGRYLADYGMSLYNKAYYIDVKNYEVYTSEGQTITLVPVLSDFNGNRIDINDSNLMFTWSDIYGNVVGYGSTYVIESAYSMDKFSGEHYTCQVSYEGSDHTYMGWFYVHIDNQEISYCEYSSAYCKSLGESVELEAYLCNGEGAIIDLSSDEYRFEWYGVSRDDEIEEDVMSDIISTDRILTIDNLRYSDFYDSDTKKRYVCYVYKNDEKIDANSYYYIYNSDEYVNSTNVEKTVKIGGTVTLTPRLTDIDYNKINLTGSEYNFEWYGYSNEYGDYVELGNSASLTIDKVKESDVYDSYILCKIYKDNKLYASQYFYLYESTEEETTPPSDDEEPTVKEETTPSSGDGKPSTEEETTTKPSGQNTAKPSEDDKTTTKAPETTVTPTTKALEVKKPAKVKIKKVYSKKKASKVAKIKIKKVKGAAGYQIQIAKDKKFKSKNILVKKNVKKLTSSITSKKFKNKKKLYVRVRAYVFDAKGKKIYGKWSVVKKVKVK